MSNTKGNSVVMPEPQGIGAIGAKVWARTGACRSSVARPKSARPLILRGVSNRIFVSPPGSSFFCYLCLVCATTASMAPWNSESEKGGDSRESVTRTRREFCSSCTLTFGRRLALCPEKPPLDPRQEMRLEGKSDQEVELITCLFSHGSLYLDEFRESSSTSLPGYNLGGRELALSRNILFITRPSEARIVYRNSYIPGGRELALTRTRKSDLARAPPPEP